MQCCAVCCTEQYQAQFRWHSESVPPAVIEASVQCPVSRDPPIKAGGFQGSPAVVIDPQRTMLEHNRINGSLWSLYERLSHQPSVGNNLVYQLDERQLLFMWTSKPPMCRFGNFIPHKTTSLLSVLSSKWGFLPSRFCYGEWQKPTSMFVCGCHYIRDAAQSCERIQTSLRRNLRTVFSHSDLIPIIEFFLPSPKLYTFPSLNVSPCDWLA